MTLWPSLARGCTILVDPVPHWAWLPLLCNTNTGGIPDNSEAAEEHSDKDDYLLPDIQQRLYEYLESRFPSAFANTPLEVEEEWAGN